MEDFRRKKLLETFDYDPLSGTLTKKFKNGKRKSNWSLDNGYVRI